MASVVQDLGLKIPNLRVKRPHTKSRLGCKTCKRRRVKVRIKPRLGHKNEYDLMTFGPPQCDEAKPRCGSCQFRDLDCVYASEERSKIIHLTTADSPHHSKSPDSSPSSSPGDIGSSPELPGTDITETALTQYFLTHSVPSFTYISNRPSQNEFWSTLTPSLAYTSPLVRHGMLAIAAIDMYFATQKEEPLRLAEYHGDLAIKKCGIHLQNIVPEEFDYILVGSRMLCLLGFAFWRNYREHGITVGNSKAWTWVNMIRGVAAVQKTITSSADRGHSLAEKDLAEEMNPILGNGAAEEGVSFHAISDRQKVLLDFIQQSAAERFVALRAALKARWNDLGDRVAGEFQAAIEHLEYSTAHLFSPLVQSYWRTMCMWPCSISPELVDRLTNSDGFALAIHAHWFMLVMLVEDLWWVHDMGRVGICEIADLCSGDEQLRSLLVWPLYLASLPRDGEEMP